MSDAPPSPPMLEYASQKRYRGARRPVSEWISTFLVVQVGVSAWFIALMIDVRQVGELVIYGAGVIPLVLGFRSGRPLDQRRSTLLLIRSLSVQVAPAASYAQLSAYLSDVGHPQPRWRIGLLDPSLLAAAAIAFTFAAATTLPEIAKVARRRHTIRTSTP